MSIGNYLKSFKTYFLKYSFVEYIVSSNLKVCLKKVSEKRIGLGTWSWGNKIFGTIKL